MNHEKPEGARLSGQGLRDNETRYKYLKNGSMYSFYPQPTLLGLLFELHTRISVELEAESIVYVLCEIVWGRR